MTTQDKPGAAGRSAETVDRELALLSSVRALYGGSLTLINALLDERNAYRNQRG